MNTISLKYTNIKGDFCEKYSNFSKSECSEDSIQNNCVQPNKTETLSNFSGLKAMNLMIWNHNLKV